MSPRPHYSPAARSAHWLMAALIVAAFSLGLYMVDLPLSPQKLKLISYHKWLGVAVLALVLWRMYVRFTRPVPPPLAGPDWQRRIAATTHTLLYLLMIAVPMSGWLMSSAKGFQVVFLGVVPLPDLVGKNEALGDLLATAHVVLNYTLLALVGLHVAAAVKHHLVDRDATLARMIPALRRVEQGENA